jgi:hypothetical protein
MKSLYQPRWGASQLEQLQERRRAEELMRLRGDNRKPDPPRDLMSQPGSRSALVTWKPPIEIERVAGYRVFTPTERDLFDTFEDPLLSSVTIPLSSGATPASQAVYVSCFSRGGIESNRVQVICSPTAEAGAPAQPTPVAQSSVVDESASDTDVFRPGSGRSISL